MLQAPGIRSENVLISYKPQNAWLTTPHHGKEPRYQKQFLLLLACCHLPDLCQATCSAMLGGIVCLRPDQNGIHKDQDGDLGGLKYA